MYQKSAFNLLINGELLWNSGNGAFVLLSPDEAADYRRFSGAEEDSPLFTQLEKNGFFVPAGTDEVGALLARERRFLLDEAPEDLFYSIAPTLRCNYRCEYCFEADRDLYADMEDETAARVVRFLERAVTENPNLKRVHVTFFGGEPLLRLRTIDALCGALESVCGAAGAVFRPTIITNGRFLDDEALEVLRRHRFRSVQVSLDFTCETYCQVRGATRADFETTIRNITRAAQKLERVIVRINVRDHDITDAKALVRLLLEQTDDPGALRFYLANIKEGERCERESRYRAFVRSETAFVRWITETYGARYFHKMPMAKGVSCRLSCDSNFCIGPTGELYKCDYHFGKSGFIVGDVINGVSPEKREWYHAFTLRRALPHACGSCKMLPVCMGGCVNNQIQGEKIFHCESFIEQMIRRKTASHLPNYDFGEEAIRWE